MRQHAVLVRAPLGEARQVGRDLVRVGVEDVRPVAVDEDAVLVVVVEGVAADMRAAVDQQHALARPRPPAARPARCRQSRRRRSDSRSPPLPAGAGAAPRSSAAGVDFQASPLVLASGGRVGCRRYAASSSEQIPHLRPGADPRTSCRAGCPRRAASARRCTASARLASRAATIFGAWRRSAPARSRHRSGPRRGSAWRPPAGRRRDIPGSWSG